jgi:hypothetical protein
MSLNPANDSKLPQYLLKFSNPVTLCAQNETAYPSETGTTPRVHDNNGEAAARAIASS